jgi:uncharacterized phage protein (TIGR01671 family)
MTQREIKFRAWDKNKKKMFPRVTQIMFGTPHNLVQCVDGLAYIENTTDVELMQFTGLRDKNQKEIYEGDVIFTKEDKLHRRGVLEWSDFHARYYITTPKEWGPEHNIPGGSRSSDMSILHNEDWEVIGNIYENPDLLQK